MHWLSSWNTQINAQKRRLKSSPGRTYISVSIGAKNSFTTCLFHPIIFFTDNCVRRHHAVLAGADYVMLTQRHKSDGWLSVTGVLDAGCWISHHNYLAWQLYCIFIITIAYIKCFVKQKCRIMRIVDEKCSFMQSEDNVFVSFRTPSAASDMRFLPSRYDAGVLL